MNLLQRSLNSQQQSTSSNPAPKKSTASSYAPATHATNTHLLFHLNEPYGNFFNGPPASSSSFSSPNAPGRGMGKKPSTSGKPGATGGFLDLHHSNPASSSFDYYEYFSNYGRILATPPHSPNALDHFNDRAGVSGSNAAGATGAFGDHSFKRFWRRSGPPKYQPISATDSPERSRDIYRGESGNSGLRGGTPSPQLGRHPSRSTRLPSSPSSPGLCFMDAAPLLSPPSDPPMVSMLPSSMGPSASSSSTATAQSIHPSSGPTPHRISFIETNLYIPIDLPSSPDSLPVLPRRGPHGFMHAEWVHHTVNQLKSQFKSVHNQILINVERKSRYPFIIYGYPGPGFDPSAGPILPTAAFATLSPELRIFDGLYDIASSLIRPGSNYDAEDRVQPLGYIVSAFQTFPGEDSEKLERNWLTWTD
ncbi:uncharacterized protein LOC128392701 isoform X2 [Panonychus citri]|uniref:uncharacterized protein LOC128392701 isoform X2 n=1 Tax=Panonychus citri TaxID=50023 RepID=UPI00230772D5|nr:uncharacterized protein LOC128392701 isoform X2 [Panonychus citri]